MEELQSQLLAGVRAIWRRRWIVLLAAWVFSIVGWTFVLLLPDTYQSRARIYVDTKTLLTPLLRGIALPSNLDQQVAFMRRTLLSRPNVAQVIRMTDMDLTVQDDAEMQELVQEMARQIRVRSQGKDLFTVAFTDSNPRLAQRVVQSVINIFVEQNLGENRSEMEKARAFLETQIAQYERQLRASESRLADFRAENMEFIGRRGGFLGRLEKARGNLSGAQADLQDTIVLRDQLRDQLETVPQFFEVDLPPQLIVNNGGQNSPIDYMRGRIRSAEQQLDAMLFKYTDQHPDVIAQQRTIDRLNSQMEDLLKQEAAAKAGVTEDGKPASPKSRVPNVVYEQLKLRLVDIESQVASKTRRVESAMKGLEALEKKADEAPRVEARLTDLNRDYKVIKENYVSLLERRESAKIAQAVDAETDIQFRIVDPPEVPNTPTGPNRPLFMAVVLAASFGAGITMAYLLAQMDFSFSSPSKLREAFGMPVLGVVTALASDQQRKWQTLDIVGVSTAAICLVLIFGGLIVFEPRLGTDLIQLGLDKLL